MFNTDNFTVPEHKLGDGYIYVLEVKREDGEEFYYVGSTSQPVENRLRNHANGSVPNAMPVNRGGTEMLGDTSEQSFELVKVDRVIAVDFSDRDRLLEKERETAYRVAIEYETTNVCGVHP